MDKVIEGGKITTNEYSIMSPYFFQLATDNSCHDMINFKQIEKICAISKENLLLENNDDYIIQVSFSSPEQNILLQAHKVHIKLNHTENRTFATISCQLLEPINYIWKERVIKLLESNEK